MFVKNKNMSEQIVSINKPLYQFLLNFVTVDRSFKNPWLWKKRKKSDPIFDEIF